MSVTCMQLNTQPFSNKTSSIASMNYVAKTMLFKGHIAFQIQWLSGAVHSDHMHTLYLIDCTLNISCTAY